MSRAHAVLSKVREEMDDFLKMLPRDPPHSVLIMLQLGESSFVVEHLHSVGNDTVAVDVWTDVRILRADQPEDEIPHERRKVRYLLPIERLVLWFAPNPLREGDKPLTIDVFPRD